MVDQEESGLGEAMAALRRDVKQRLSALTRVAKALDALTDPAARTQLDVLGKHVEALRDADLGSVGLSESQHAVASEIELLHERLKARARAEVFSELVRLGEGLEIVQLAENPLTVLIAPLVAELDISAGSARIVYARETLDETKLDARLILDARQKAMDEIRACAVESPVFFDLALRAYRTVLAVRSLGPEERVDLVDLLAPLSLFQTELRRWRDIDRGTLTPYPRHLLAYQLQRLQRDGLLVKDGLRVDLGTATGGSTRNKRDVLFVPSSATEGQYYLTIRFVPQQEREPLEAINGSD